MGPRNVFPITLILLGCVVGVGCTIQPSQASTPTSLPVATSTVVIVPTATPTPVPSPSPAPSPNGGAASALNDFKYRLVAQFGAPFFCDPDLYPVAHEVADETIIQRVADLKKTLPEYQAILRHLGLASTTNLSIEQTRAVYAEGKLLDSITLKPVGDQYEFSLRVGASRSGEAVSGVIDPSGAITVASRTPAALNCPICLAVNTLIDTPQGQIAIQDVQPGIPVWTLDAIGARRAAPVLEIIRRPVPVGFGIVRVVLDDGRQVLVSPNHPLLDGRVIGELNAGDFLDGAFVQSAVREPYAGEWTFDILPEGVSGAYWANGILLKSTLANKP